MPDQVFPVLAHHDICPGAGRDGGDVVFQGTPSDLVAERSTLIGQHLARYIGA